MTRTTPPHSPDADGRAPAVEVDVARTGGIAGITRRWSAQPPETDAREWISLIDRCPWDEAAGAAAASPAEAGPALKQAHPPMPDGFVWWIRATWSGADPREAELFDDQLVGAWRELVDAVREWSPHTPGPERAGR